MRSDDLARNERIQPKGVSGCRSPVASAPNEKSPSVRDLIKNLEFNSSPALRTQSPQLLHLRARSNVNEQEALEKESFRSGSSAEFLTSSAAKDAVSGTSTTTSRVPNNCSSDLPTPPRDDTSWNNEKKPNISRSCVDDDERNCPITSCNYVGDTNNAAAAPPVPPVPRKHTGSDGDDWALSTPTEGMDVASLKKELRRAAEKRQQLESSAPSFKWGRSRDEGRAVLQERSTYPGSGKIKGIEKSASLSGRSGLGVKSDFHEGSDALAYGKPVKKLHSSSSRAALPNNREVHRINEGMERIKGSCAGSRSNAGTDECSQGVRRGSGDFTDSAALSSSRSGEKRAATSIEDQRRTLILGLKEHLRQKTPIETSAKSTCSPQSGARNGDVGKSIDAKSEGLLVDDAQSSGDSIKIHDIPSMELADEQDTTCTNLPLNAGQGCGVANCNELDCEVGEEAGGAIDSSQTSHSNKGDPSSQRDSSGSCQNAITETAPPVKTPWTPHFFPRKQPLDQKKVEPVKKPYICQNGHQDKFETPSPSNSEKKSKTTARVESGNAQPPIHESPSDFWASTVDHFCQKGGVLLKKGRKKLLCVKSGCDTLSASALENCHKTANIMRDLPNVGRVLIGLGVTSDWGVMFSLMSMVASMISSVYPTVPRCNFCLSMMMLYLQTSKVIISKTAYIALFILLALSIGLDLDWVASDYYPETLSSLEDAFGYSIRQASSGTILVARTSILVNVFLKPLSFLSLTRQTKKGRRLLRELWLKVYIFCPPTSMRLPKHIQDVTLDRVIAVLWIEMLCSICFLVTAIFGRLKLSWSPNLNTSAPFVPLQYLILFKGTSGLVFVTAMVRKADLPTVIAKAGCFCGPCKDWYRHRRSMLRRQRGFDAPSVVISDTLLRSSSCVKAFDCFVSVFLWVALKWAHGLGGRNKPKEIRIVLGVSTVTLLLSSVLVPILLITVWYYYAMGKHEISAEDISESAHSRSYHSSPVSSTPDSYDGSFELTNAEEERPPNVRGRVQDRDHAEDAEYDFANNVQMSQNVFEARLLEASPPLATPARISKTSMQLRHALPSEESSALDASVTCEPEEFATKWEELTNGTEILCQTEKSPLISDCHHHFERQHFSIIASGMIRDEMRIFLVAQHAGKQGLAELVFDPTNKSLRFTVKSEEATLTPIFVQSLNLRLLFGDFFEV